MDIRLKCKLKVIGIKKRNSSKFFKDVKVNDILVLSTNLKVEGTYAKTVDIENITTGQKDTKYFGHLQTINDFYILEEIQ